MKALSENIRKGKTGKEKNDRVRETFKAELASQEKGVEIKFENTTCSKKKAQSQ